MADRGTLERIVVRAYKTPNFAESGFVAQFEAQVNPHELTLAYEIEYDSAQGAGTTGSRMEFKRIKPGDLTLAFFLDGTGANGRPLDVQERVADFRRVTGYNGDIHRPNYLIILWGTLQVKRCILKSASITYKLFKSDGVPLRAVITATFTESTDDQTREAREQNHSADLTHRHLVRAGENLPLLCHQIYGDPQRYLKVAEFNRLIHFRKLTPGTVLLFPPMEK